ncbi:MAG: hypothetical protein ACI4GA_01805 [Acutalibacteraceae bacterium]|nr:hypothetical protein [Oscillospiraceae bacterium]
MKKLLVALIAVIVIGASIAFGYFIAKHPSDNKDNTPSVSVNVSADAAESTSESGASSSAGETTEKTTSNESTEKGGKSDSVKELILGSWTDNANFSGYEFLPDGIIKVTYFNMETLDLEDVISGTYTGTYELDGNNLTINYTIYSKAVTKSFKVKVDENTLTLTDEKGEDAIYVRKGASAVMKNIDKKLLGSWKSNLNGYDFKETGIVAITYIDLSSMGINIPINGTVNGVYTINGDELTIKYSIYSGVITKNFKYKIDGKVLTLTDKKSGEKGTYIKDE